MAINYFQPLRILGIFTCVSKVTTKNPNRASYQVACAARQRDLITSETDYGYNATPDTEWLKCGFVVA